MFKTYDNWKTTEPDSCCGEPRERDMDDRIRTEFVFPPILTRDYDWMAYWEGEEGLGMYGYGSSEARAIAELIENYPREEG